MLVNNNFKKIYDVELQEEIGNMYSYVVEPKTGIIKYIIYGGLEKEYYIPNENIIEIGENIKVNGHVKETPEDVDLFIKIYPCSTIMDSDAYSYGNDSMLDVTGGTITKLVASEKDFKINRLIAGSEAYTFFNTKSEEGSEENPDDDCPDTEKSFKYSSILGKTATKSIYSCNNTPIIAKCETVELENIISAVNENKLIELIKNIE